MGLISRVSSRTYRYYYVGDMERKVIVDRLKIKPRDYSDLIGLTKDLKSEVNHHISLQLRLRIEEEMDKVRRKQDMEIQKMRGFSGDMREQSRIGGGNH